MAEMRNFALRDKDGNEIGVFTGSYPDGRHLKAANRGSYRNQVERTGKQEVHIFTGEHRQKLCLHQRYIHFSGSQARGSHLSRTHVISYSETISIGMSWMLKS